MLHEASAAPKHQDQARTDIQLSAATKCALLDELSLSGSTCIPHTAHAPRRPQLVLPLGSLLPVLCPSLLLSLLLK